MQMPPHADIEAQKFKEHVFINHDATVCESQLGDGAEDQNSSTNLFSSSSSLSEEMDISETEGSNHRSQHLAAAETECTTQQPEEIIGKELLAYDPQLNITDRCSEVRCEYAHIINFSKQKSTYVQQTSTEDL